MSFLSPVHIVFFAAIALLALGPRRFPEFMRTLGNAVREVRAVVNGAGGIQDVVGEGASRARTDATIEALAPPSVAAGETPAALQPSRMAAAGIGIAPPPAP